MTAERTQDLVWYDNPWDTRGERLLATNMGRTTMRSVLAPSYSSRTSVAAGTRNVVGSASMTCYVHPADITRRFPPIHTPDFTSLVKRMSGPYTTALISTGGFTVMVGTASVNSMLLGLHHQRLGLVELGYRPTLHYVSADNRVVSGSVPYIVEIANYEDDVCDIMWAPFLFPAGIIRFENPKGTGMMFRGGSFNLVGMSREEDINVVYAHFMKVLELHSIDLFDSAATSNGGVDGELSAALPNQNQRDMIRTRGGRKDAGAHKRQKVAGAADEEINLMPKQYTEFLRRVNQRLDATGARGEAMQKIFIDEMEKIRAELEATRKTKETGGRR